MKNRTLTALPDLIKRAILRSQQLLSSQELGVLACVFNPDLNNGIVD
jgi:hypothetical protein